MEQQDAALLLTDGALGGLSLEQQEPGHFLVLGSLSTLSFAGSERVLPDLAEETMGASALEQQASAQLLFAGGSFAGLPPEQHGFEQLSLTGGLLIGLSLAQQEPTQAPIGDFLTDLQLSELFRKRRRFCAAWSLVTVPVLQQESTEVRMRERVDDFLEHDLAPTDGRSRVSQQDS